MKVMEGFPTRGSRVDSVDGVNVVTFQPLDAREALVNQK